MSGFLALSSGCGSKNNSGASGAGAGVVTQAATLRVTVPAGMIGSRVASALSESLTVAPGTKPDPEKIPRFFLVSRLDSRDPNRPVYFENQFDPKNGTASLEIPARGNAAGKGLWIVRFTGASEPLSSLLPAFWWRIPQEGVALSRQSTLWTEVAEAVHKKNKQLFPHADVWWLLSTAYKFNADNAKDRAGRRQKAQLTTWINKALARFKGGRIPEGGRVYDVLVALATTPLEGDPEAKVARAALVVWHKNILDVTQRAMQSPGQGKPLLREVKLADPLAHLNSAPSTLEAFTAYLREIEILHDQVGAWPFEESPRPDEAALLDFTASVAPPKEPPATPPRPPVIQKQPVMTGQPGQPRPNLPPVSGSRPSLTPSQPLSPPGQTTGPKPDWF